MANLAKIVNRVFCHQPLLYWQKIGSDKNGQPSYLDPLNPAQLQCRFEEKDQEVLNWQGRKVLSKGYILIITELVEGSLVFQGSLADWQALPNYPDLPTVAQGGSEVMKTKTTPDLKARSRIYECYL